MPRTIVLNLRTHPRGGSAQQIREGTPLTFAPAAKRVLLVHGYNVSRREAETSYEAFEAILSKYSRSLSSQCCWVLWPGDAWFPGVRTLAYPIRLRHAKIAALELAEYLKACATSDGRPSEVVIIAHSLGCRVVLEALGQMTGETNKVKPTLILMAAAVPIRLVDSGGALNPALAVAQEACVMFSRHDWVLRRVFALGQRIACDATSAPLEAVGEWGLPAGAWLRRRELLFHDHSDYWDSNEAARVAAGWLNVPVLREIQGRPTRALPFPIDRQPPPARPMPGDRVIGRRVVAR